MTLIIITLEFRLLKTIKPQVSIYVYQLVPNSLAKIIIGGGDGSILHVIEYLENQGVNVHNCLFGVLPLGTRNDLSSTLGWGGS